MNVGKQIGRPHWLRVVMSGVVMQAAKYLGMKIIDQRTGLPIGRALIFPWRGTIIVIPSNRDISIRPEFLPRKTVRYRSQEIAFYTYEPPDFPNERRDGLDAAEEGK